MTLDVIRHGMRSERCRELQAATNRRLRARGLDRHTVREDGVCGMQTLEACKTAARYLGALESTYRALPRNREIPVGVQRMIRNPGLRNRQQLERARVRMANLRAERAARAKQAAKSTARARAVNAFLAHVGTTESPPGSNSGGIITTINRYWGYSGIPWCGAAAGYFAVTGGGIEGLRSDVVSVAAIEDHARAGHAPYGRWQASVTGLLQASFVVIGGRGVHVAMLVEALAGGNARTVEGNTSFDDRGSQSNGGALAARTRYASQIHGAAAMNYPG